MRFWLLLTMLTVNVPSPTLANEDRFWIIWERIKYIGQHCPNGAACLVDKTYASRPLDTDNTAFIYRLFGVSEGRNHASHLLGEHPNAPQICPDNQVPLALGFEPEALPRSEKVEALRGVQALHVDLNGLKAPPGFGDNFGQVLHAKFVKRLEAGGVRVVDKDTLSRLPGQPVLNLYFSFTNSNGDCDYAYSVFAALNQDVLLARDLRIKIPAGVWSFSTGSAARDHSGNEEDAILRVASAFLRDHRKVNGR
ncbi:hypothetical protein BXY66_2447 [Shimia isoporae]|uniref:Chitosanase (Glycosyl hydrolase group 75) n=1 Tax=Shimia isoporae TaxID=647720 RepID=A0A4R1N372_9RHOB|nr:hypothetical protein [Shimia isoporae]TCL01138.1 hypothetical protein BXY66_2447 [Shimia isoporae]